MSRISDLRENEANKINIVKIFELFYGETKYVELFLKLFKNNSTPGITARLLADKTKIDIEKLKTLSNIELEFLFRIYSDSIIGRSFIDFKKFMEYSDKNLIENKDLHSYKSFHDIADEVINVEEKIVQKELEKQITKFYEDNEWLILTPNTYESSLKYGYNTKWCTASDKTDEQYKSYTRDGILVYIINKGNKKVAVYKKRSNGEVTFWDQKDLKIDSFQANFPHHIMDIIRKVLDDDTLKNNPKKTEPVPYVDFNDLFDIEELAPAPVQASIPPTLSRLRNPSMEEELQRKMVDLNSPEYLDRVRSLISRISR